MKLFEIFNSWALNYFEIQQLNFRLEEAFYVLYVLPIIFILGVRFIWLKRKQSKELGVRFPVWREALVLMLVLLAVAFATIALADPYGITIKEQPVYSGRAVDFILDLTESQKANDLLPNRIEATKFKILKATDKLSQEGVSYFCLGYFAASQSINRVRSCTDDISSFKETLKLLGKDIQFQSGTNLIAAFSEDYAAVKEYLPKGMGITVLVFTDGGREIWRNSNGQLIFEEPDWNEAEVQARIRLLASQGIEILPVGVGGKIPVPVPINNSDGKKDYIRNSKGQILYTMLDEKLISNLAKWSGHPGRYFILNQNNAGLENWLLSQIKSNRVVDHLRREEKIRDDIWIYPQIIAVILGALSAGVLRFLGLLKQK